MSTQKPRYVVRSLEGLRQPSRGGDALPGREYMVMDRLDCYRVVASYRSDIPDRGRSRAKKIADAERLAEREFERLNAASERRAA